MSTSARGKLFRDGETIVRQGDVGDCIYMIQEGQVEVLVEEAEGQVQVAKLRERELFGEMALFGREIRSASVRALGEARVLKVDKENLLRAIDGDPHMAVQIIQVLCTRLKVATRQLVALRLKDRRQHHRIPVTAEVVLSSDTQKAATGLLRNLSRSGACVESEGMLALGQRLRVTLAGGDVGVEADVVRARPAGQYALRFSHILTTWERLFDEPWPGIDSVARFLV